jgi:hypothetical protein
LSDSFSLVPLVIISLVVQWARRVSLRWLNAKRRAAVESGPSQLEFLCALVLGARTALTLHPESAPETELKCDSELKITVPAVTTKGLPVHPLRSFEFKDYAAGVFAKLRAAAGIRFVPVFPLFKFDSLQISTFDSLQSGHVLEFAGSRPRRSRYRQSHRHQRDSQQR